MNKYYLVIGVLAVASLIVAAYFLQQLTVEYDGEFLKELEEERHMYAETEKIRAQKQDIRKMFEFTSLEKEKAEEAQQIAQSDDITHAVLQVLGEYEVEASRGPLTMVILRYSSPEEWVLHVTVNMEKKRVESISATRGMVPLGLNLKEVMEIAEKRFSQNEFGKPLMGKISQSGKNAEVVFLTEEGTVTVTIDLEEEKVVNLEKQEKGQRTAEFVTWWPWLLLVILLVAGVIGILILRRPSESTESMKEESENLED